MISWHFKLPFASMSLSLLSPNILIFSISHSSTMPRQQWVKLNCVKRSKLQGGGVPLACPNHCLPLLMYTSYSIVRVLDLVEFVLGVSNVLFTKHTFSSASAKTSDVRLWGFDLELFQISKWNQQLPHISHSAEGFCTLSSSIYWYINTIYIFLYIWEIAQTTVKVKFLTQGPYMRRLLVEISIHILIRPLLKPKASYEVKLQAFP